MPPTLPLTISVERDIYDVSRLNQEARLLLEGHFPLVWVEGELSNVAKPSSGHIYFSLKDKQAQVRCALFRTRMRGIDAPIENGTQVVVRGKVSLYEGRGDYQLIVEHLEEVGDGALQRAFDALKKQLLKEGLFDAKFKKPLPELPKCIGLVTSPTGAAVRDIITVLKRRFPSIPIIIYPSEVQGKTAAGKIVKALTLANQHQHCDVLILARGGGSLEDLWSFNEESVARAIFASEIPIVSGVGHEVDVTIADFVADQRAATPSAAAELIVPDQQYYIHQFERLKQQIFSDIRNAIFHRREEMMHLSKRLQHPQRRLQEYAQRIDTVEQRLVYIMKNYLSRMKTMNVNIAHALNAMSPLATIARGYAIVTTGDNKIVRKAQELKSGDCVSAQLGQGTIHCTVNQVLKKRNLDSL